MPCPETRKATWHPVHLQRRVLQLPGTQRHPGRGRLSDLSGTHRMCIAVPQEPSAARSVRSALSFPYTRWQGHLLTGLAGGLKFHR